MKPAALARIILSRVRTNIITSHILLPQCLTRLGGEDEVIDDLRGRRLGPQVCCIYFQRRPVGERRAKIIPAQRPIDRVGIGELADLHSRLVSDPLLEFIRFAREQDEVDLAAVVFGRCDQRTKMVVVLTACVNEGVNKVNAFTSRFADRRETDRFDQPQEWRRAEFENGPDTIDAHVIVKQFEPGPPGYLSRNCEFADSRCSLDDDQLHNFTSVKDNRIARQYHLR